MQKHRGTSQVSWENLNKENNKEYRRNRKHLLKTTEEICSSPEKTSTMDMDEPVYSEYDTMGVCGDNEIETSGNSIQEETNVTLAKSPVVSKVSGRVIRRPVRYMSLLSLVYYLKNQKKLVVVYIDIYGQFLYLEL
jgi:hypothetical protein